MVIFLKMRTDMFKVPLSTVARHTDNIILKDTVQLKIYQFHKNPSLYFKEHCTKIDDISFLNTLLFFSNTVFKFNLVLISIFDSFGHSFFTFLRFDYLYYTDLEVYPVPLNLFFYKNH